MTANTRANLPPGLEPANLHAGDIAICGAFADTAALLAALDPERVAFVAPLDSRSDLESILRALHRHPGVRHLVVSGDDHRAAGEALLALWREGLDESGRLPGSRGRLSGDLDSASVDALRGDVVALDWRGNAVTELADGIRGLPIPPMQREARTLPDPAAAERRVFLSRKTSFPIFSNDPADAWLQLLNLALRIGTERRAPDGRRLAEALNTVVTIGLPVIAEDLEREALREVSEVASFLDYHPEDFDRYYQRFDPLEAICGQLKDAVGSHAGTTVLIDGRDLRGPRAAAGPVSATFNVLDGSLFASYVVPSADVYGDWPLEALALVRLQREAAERLGLEAGAATFVIHSAHLFEHDWSRAEQVLAESFKRPLPLQVDHSGIFLFGNDGGAARGMLLDHDAGTIYWEQAFENPEDLSWYIIDVMPWLLPQHIRYVGQECSTLMRAIREGECYEQG